MPDLIQPPLRPQREFSFGKKKNVETTHLQPMCPKKFTHHSLRIISRDAIAGAFSNRDNHPAGGKVIGQPVNQKLSADEPFTFFSDVGNDLRFTNDESFLQVILTGHGRSLLVDIGRQLLAALLAALGQDFAAAGSFHAGHEAVFGFAFAFAWLKSALHIR